MKRLLYALVVAAMLLSGVPAAGAHAIYGSHANVCEGTFGFDHPLRADSGGWYHSMTRYLNVAGFYTVIQRHYLQAGGILQFQHQTGYNYCAEGSHKSPYRPPGT
jgi:hypothetical protein